MTLIRSVHSWMALDSRGWPTVAVRVDVVGGHGVALAPAGASAGSHEDPERRDGMPAWEGRGVGTAIALINGRLAEAMVGQPAEQPIEIDCVLEESKPDGGWGANATVAFTLATALAVANARKLEPWQWFAELTETRQPTLPMPMVNIVSGGAHAGRAVDIQDILVIPVSARSFGESIEMAAAVRREAARLAGALDIRLGALVADEGGVSAAGHSNGAAFETVAAAISRVGLTGKVRIAVDIAATQFARGGEYDLASEGRVLVAEDFATQLAHWSSSYGIVSIEDPFAEDDWSTWASRAAGLGVPQVIGDDLIATSVDRLEKAAETGAANTVLVKPNQAGTLGRTLRVLSAARRLGMATVVSARSGETEESWLSDLAVGAAAGQIKVGSTHRSERTAKWNRLLELEARHGASLPFAGVSGLAHHHLITQGESS